MEFPCIFALIKTIIFANLSQYNANTAISAFYIARHQLVKLGIAWEFIDKRNKRAANLEKPPVLHGHSWYNWAESRRYQGAFETPYSYGRLIDNRQIRSRIECYTLSFIVAHFPKIEKVCKLFF